MTLHISETFINQTKGYRFGDSEPFDTDFEPDEIGKLFRSLQKEYGRCTSRVYLDTNEGTKAIGWVFEKRMEYEDSPHYDPYGNEGYGSYRHEYYIREVWVTVYDAPPTKTIEYHYYDFGRAA